MDIQDTQAQLPESGRKRIVVVGAGIVGACCAAWLALDGHTVVLLDAADPGSGASFGNAGALSPGSCVPLAMPGMLRKVPSWLMRADGPLVVRPAYFPKALPWLLRFAAAGRPDRIGAIADAMRALHRHTHDSYRPLLKAAGASDLVRRSGALVVYRTGAGFDAGAAEWRMRQERGAEFEVLEGPEIRQLVPALSADFEKAVLQTDHGHVANPQALVAALVDLVRRRGGDCVRAQARAVTDDGDRVRIDLAGAEPLMADLCVLAAGAWTGRLLRGMGLSIPLESQRGYHLHIAAPGIDLPLPVSFADGKFYATPMAGGLRLAGTVEFAGLDAPPNYDRATQVGRLARQWLPDLALADATPWMGHRPCLPDSLPVIGPIPGRRRLLCAFGHGHNGMTSAPSTGRMIADMVAGRPDFIDPRPYRIERFL